ncbi:MAG: septal ring lytic transglycosylase RlpA family protein [Mariprofundaceae bacterium]
MRRFLIPLCVGLMALLPGCGHRHPSPPSHLTAAGQAPHSGSKVKIGAPYRVNGRWYRPVAQVSGYDETGIASWYGRKFHGRKTANGERFDMHAMTAAHKTLPLPTMVRVTNLENGRSVVVRVNDRGPFVKGRLIDLSWAAAKALGFLEKGTARVRVQTLDMQPGTPTRATAPVTPHAGRIYIQLGAFASRANAERLARRVQGASVQPGRWDGGTLYRVRMGPFTRIGAIERALTRLTAQGFGDAVVVIE